jgi:AcrR family transcriptional regulator
MDRGIEGYSVDAVSAASGVAKTTIYRHFASSNELLLAALDELFDHVADIDTGSVRDDLVALTAQFVAIAQRPEMYRLLTGVLQRSASDDDFARLHRGVVAERKAPMRLAIQRGIGRGEIDPAIDVDVVASLVEGPMIARVMHDRDDFRDGEIEQIIDLVLRAVAP